MNDMSCPYCEAEQEVCHDDGQGYSEDEAHQHCCSNCGKMFVFYTFIMFSYDPYKADCLNDSEHVFEGTHTWPVKHSRMRCTMCSEERQPTSLNKFLRREVSMKTAIGLKIIQVKHKTYQGDEKTSSLVIEEGGLRIMGVIPHHTQISFDPINAHKLIKFLKTQIVAPELVVGTDAIIFSGGIYAPLL